MVVIVVVFTADGCWLQSPFPKVMLVEEQSKISVLALLLLFNDDDASFDNKSDDDNVTTTMDY